MVLSATLTSKVLQSVQKFLQIEDGKHLMIQQPLDWLNIFLGACVIASKKNDWVDLAFLLNPIGSGSAAPHVENILQAIIFQDSVADLELTEQSLDAWLLKAGRWQRTDLTKW